jgi:WD40 repeat protein
MQLALLTVAYASGSVLADDEPDSWRIFSEDSDSRISALAMSDDGTRLAVGGDNGALVVINSTDGSVQRRFQAADDHRINAVAFLADDRIAVGDDDGRIAVWRLADEPVMESHVRHPKWITSLAATADKRLLIASDATRTVRLYELPLTPGFAELAPQASGVKHVAFSADDKLLVTSSDRSATVWAVEHLKPLRELKSNGVVRDACFTPGGGLAITASEDGAARTFDVETGERKRSLTGHAGMVWCLAVSPDGTRVATGGFDQTVRVWELESGRRLHIFRGPTTPIIGVQWSRDGTSLIVAGEEQILRRFSLPMESAP